MIGKLPINTLFIQKCTHVHLIKVRMDRSVSDESVRSGWYADEDGMEGN